MKSSLKHKLLIEITATYQVQKTLVHRAHTIHAQPFTNSDSDGIMTNILYNKCVI